MNHTQLAVRPYLNAAALRVLARHGIAAAARPDFEQRVNMAALADDLEPVNDLELYRGIDGLAGLDGFSLRKLKKSVTKRLKKAAPLVATLVPSMALAVPTKSNLKAGAKGMAIGGTIAAGARLLPGAQKVAGATDSGGGFDAWRRAAKKKLKKSVEKRLSAAAAPVEYDEAAASSGAASEASYQYQEEAPAGETARVPWYAWLKSEHWPKVGLGAAALLGVALLVRRRRW